VEQIVIFLGLKSAHYSLANFVVVGHISANMDESAFCGECNSLLENYTMNQSLLDPQSCHIFKVVSIRHP